MEGRHLLATALVAALLVAPELAPAQSAAIPLSRFAERKAEALLRDALPCLGCHRLNGEGGEIGPDLSTVRARRSARYIVDMIADPQRTVPGSGMPLTPMPREIRALISGYLSGHAAAPEGSTAQPSAPVGATASPSGDRSARALYARYCAACHGANGGGNGPNATFLPVKPAVHASRETMSVRSDDALYDTIAGGGAIMGRSPRMPAFGATLSRAEIRALVRHIRELCGCRGPSWSESPPPGSASGAR